LSKVKKVLLFSTQASSEHPLAKAIVEYAFHFHFFGKLPTSKDGIEQRKEDRLSQLLLQVEDFSALPGKGVQCLINGKRVLVSHISYHNSSLPFLQLS
jgi:Cu+-exporting ATPase